MSFDPLELAAQVADALEQPLPSVGLPAHLWLLGTGSHHDAAELATHLFAGSGRSCRAIPADGHAQLAGLVGPADSVVLVGGEPELLDVGRRLGIGAGATVIDLPAEVGPPPGVVDDDSTGLHVTTTVRLARLAVGAGAVGATTADFERVPGLLAALAVDPALPELPIPRRWLFVAGSGPAAVTARHGAVALRRVGLPAEGVDATDLLGGLVTDLDAGDVLLLLDSQRDVQSAAASLSRLVGALGTTVVRLDGPADLPQVVGQLLLAAQLRLLAR